MDTYWVSYTIVNSQNGGADGNGAIDVTLAAAPPADVNEIVKLADMITEVSRQRGNLRQEQHVVVTAWSKMGG